MGNPLELSPLLTGIDLHACTHGSKETGREKRARIQRADEAVNKSGATVLYIVAGVVLVIVVAMFFATRKSDV